jgi:hypothetical protein
VQAGRGQRGWHAGYLSFCHNRYNFGVQALPACLPYATPRHAFPPARSLSEPVTIVLIGKYTGLADAYLSVIKSLQHACMEARLKLTVRWSWESGQGMGCPPCFG